MTLGELDDLLKELHDAEFAEQMAQSVYVDEDDIPSKLNWIDKWEHVEKLRKMELR